MAILTKFLQLLKPEKNDYVDVEKHLSENYDKIDTKMEELSNSNDKKLDKGAVSSEYDTAEKIEDKIKTKLNQGNVPGVLNSAEKIIKALQGNTGIKFDENLLYLNDSGTKKKGLCYLDKLTDGIFECIQETTTTVNNATYFKNFSNKENSDRLSNLKYFISETGKFSLPKLKVGSIVKVVFNNTYSKPPRIIIGAEEYDNDDSYYSQVKIINRTNTFFEILITVKNLDNYTPWYSYIIIDESVY